MRLHVVDMHRGIPEELNMFQLRTNYVRRLIREAGFELVRTYGASRRRTGRARRNSSSTLRRSL